MCKCAPSTCTGPGLITVSWKLQFIARRHTSVSEGYIFIRNVIGETKSRIVKLRTKLRLVFKLIWRFVELLWIQLVVLIKWSSSFWWNQEDSSSRKKFYLEKEQILKLSKNQLRTYFNIVGLSIFRFKKNVFLRFVLSHKNVILEFQCNLYFF